MDKSLSKLKQLRKAAEKIKTAFDNGLYLKDPDYYRTLGPKYATLAFEIFQEINPPINWCYVMWRSRSAGAFPDELSFWKDDQAVLILCETLEKEGFYVCA